MCVCVCVHLALIDQSVVQNEQTNLEYYDLRFVGKPRLSDR